MKREDLEGITLFAGADETNHGSSGVKGELHVVVFSEITEDRDFIGEKRRMHHNELERWLGDIKSLKDFRFGILQDPKLKKDPNNLTYSVPLLVDSFLEKSGRKYRRLELSLDGATDPRNPAYLIYYFKKKFKQVDVVYYAKSRNRSQNYDYPRILQVADSLAYDLWMGNFALTLSEAFNHPKMVNFSAEEISLVVKQTKDFKKRS